MESMIFVCNKNKEKRRAQKILFINAKEHIVNEKGNAYLTDEHIQVISQTFKEYREIAGFSKIAVIKEVMKYKGNMNISFYVRTQSNSNGIEDADIKKVISAWEKQSSILRKSLSELIKELGKI